MTISYSMKNTTQLKRNTPLRSYTTLKRGTSQLKRSRIKAHNTESLQYQLDRIFSEYVRCIHADANSAVQCVTCGIYRRWNDRMDAGHFIPRQHMATRYDIYNVFPQCKECNRELEGNMGRFTEYLIKAFGENMVEELKEKKDLIVHDFPYKEKIEEFTIKVEQLRKEKEDNIEY